VESEIVSRETVSVAHCFDGDYRSISEFSNFTAIHTCPVYRVGVYGLDRRAITLNDEDPSDGTAKMFHVKQRANCAPNETTFHVEPPPLVQEWHWDRSGNRSMWNS